MDWLQWHPRLQCGKGHNLPLLNRIQQACCQYEGCNRTRSSASTYSVGVSGHTYWREGIHRPLARRTQQRSSIELATLGRQFHLDLPTRQTAAIGRFQHMSLSGSRKSQSAKLLTLLQQYKCMSNSDSVIFHHIQSGRFHRDCRRRSRSLAPHNDNACSIR